MKRYTLILLLTIIVVSCLHNKKEINDDLYKEIHLRLKDSLADIFIKIPKSYDTFAEWIDEEGCYLAENKNTGISPNH
ncbi:MAG: hypothetical protein U0U67_11120 [Chitinophagales bacterium]